MKRTDLLNALEQVKPGLAGKEVIQQTTSFAFMAGKVVTYNDEISISCPIEGLEIEGAVQADELYKFLNRVKADDIEMTEADSEIQIKAGRARVGLTLVEKVVLPLESISAEGKWKKLPDDFIKALEFVLFTCSQDMSRPILTCINIREDGIIESSDAHRITQYHILKIPVPTVLLPAVSAQQLVKYKIFGVRYSSSWAHFRTKDAVIFSCRIFEGEFPDTESILKVKGTEIRFPKSTSSVLDKAAVFSKREHGPDEQVKIELAEKVMTISAKSSTGWFKEECSAQYRGESISFAINPSFLSAGIEMLRKCILNEECTKIKFEGENWVHISMLMKDM